MDPSVELQIQALRREVSHLRRALSGMALCFLVVFVGGWQGGVFNVGGPAGGTAKALIAFEKGITVKGDAVFEEAKFKRIKISGAVGKPDVILEVQPGGELVVK